MILRLTALLVVGAWLAPMRATAQEPSATEDSVQAAPLPNGTPVVFEGDTLFYILTPLGPFGTADRALGVASRLRSTINDPLRSRDSVFLVSNETSTDIMVGDAVVTAVTDADAVAAGVSRDSLATIRAVAIRDVLQNKSVFSIARAVGLGLLFTSLTVAVFAAILMVFARIFPALYRKIESWRGTHVPAIRIQRLELLSADRVTDGLIATARAIRVAALLGLAFYLVPTVLSYFPWTAPMADTVFDWVLTPLRRAGRGFVDYLPNVFTIAVIVVVVYYLNRFVRLFFVGLEKGTLQLGGFYRDWADPTYKIVRFVVFAFGAIMIWPYLPGSGSDAFQGVSVFLGVLITFGSATAVANVVAGVVMTYMRPFMIGDRVRIADTVGDITKRTLLITRLRTIKNVDVTIPNAMVLSSHIVNYSSSAKHHGLILHTSVTIGYDAPWRNVHEALIAAAAVTEGLLQDPSPFVLQTALNDFYVSYELNAYTDMPNEMARLYSALHQSIQDRFNEAGIEIMSPHYAAVRDGNQNTIPEEHLPEGYQAPGFRLFPMGPTPTNPPV